MFEKSGGYKVRFLISGDQARGSKYEKQILMHILKDLGAPISGVFRLSVKKNFKVTNYYDEKNNVMVFNFEDLTVKK